MQAPAQPAYQKPVQQAPQAQAKPYQGAQPYLGAQPYQGAQPYHGQQQSFVPKPQTPVVKTPAVSPGPRVQIPRNEAVSPRSGLNSSAVSPAIFKKQIQLDAAVPVPPGAAVPTQSSPVPYGRAGGKSPVPIFNTAPAPFGFPALSVQTPETIAQVAPATTPLVPHLQNPKPLPLIISTPLPHYTSSYNNAARPFGETKDFYRPINMDSVSHKLVPPVVYTDF